MARLDSSTPIADDYITDLADQDCRIDLHNLVAGGPLPFLLNATYRLGPEFRSGIGNDLVDNELARQGPLMYRERRTLSPSPPLAKDEEYG